MTELPDASGQPARCDHAWRRFWPDAPDVRVRALWYERRYAERPEVECERCGAVGFRARRRTVFLYADARQDALRAERAAALAEAAAAE